MILKLINIFIIIKYFNFLFCEFLCYLVIHIKKFSSIIILFFTTFFCISCEKKDIKNISNNNWIESTTAIYELTELHYEGRFPNIVSNNNGVIVSTWGKDSIFVKVSKDNGDNWSEKIFISKGINAGGLTFNYKNNEFLFFIEDKHPPSSVISLIKSKDFFQTFSKKNVTNFIEPNSIHMNDHGIVLKSNKFKSGRIIIPSRNYGNGIEQENWGTHFSNSIYSDDNGDSWKISEKFPVFGTGEGTIVELNNGILQYNSRRHYSSHNFLETRNRNIAYSYDGGISWKNHGIDLELPDGDQCRDYGLMGSLIKIPYEERLFLLFSNIDSECGRKKGTIWFTNEDGDSKWKKKLIYNGDFGYSSMTFNVNTKTREDEIFIFFETGMKDAATNYRGKGVVLKTNLAYLKN